MSRVCSAPVILSVRKSRPLDSFNTPDQSYSVIKKYYHITIAHNISMPNYVEALATDKK